MILEYRKTRLEHGISKTTTNRELSLLKKMFTWAQERGLCEENPAQRIKKFSEADTVRDRVLTEQEEARLMKELAPHVRPIILTALHTGMRYREILNLPWKNINLDKRTLKVEHTKSKKARFIPINSLLYETLKALKANGSNGSLVFPFKNITKAFENARRRAALEDFVFHDLRRSFGTRLLEKGANIFTISKLYGHCNVVVTQNYLHPKDELSREAVETLANETGKSAKRPENLAHGWHMEKGENFGLPLNSLFSMN
jgi:integrase